MPSPKINTGAEARAAIPAKHQDLLDKFLNVAADSDKTRRHYGRVIARYLAGLDLETNPTALQNAKQADVIDYIESYGKIARATIRNYLAILSSFYDWLIGRDDETYHRNPALLARKEMVRRLSKTKGSKKTLNAFRADDFEHLVETRRKLCIRPNGDREIERDIAILNVFFGTGIRHEELHQLTLNQYDDRAGVFHLTGKGDKHRSPAILVESQEVLRHYLAEIRPMFDPLGKSQYMFLSVDQDNPESSRQMTYDQIGYMIRKVIKASGLFAEGDGGTHVFRRSHGTHLARSGISLEGVKDQLGHADISTTDEHYIKRIEGENQANIRDMVGIKRRHRNMSNKQPFEISEGLLYLLKRILADNGKISGYLEHTYY